jgi:hypothetical protein
MDLEAHVRDDQLDCLTIMVEHQVAMLALQVTTRISWDQVGVIPATQAHMRLVMDLNIVFIALKERTIIGRTVPLA